MNAITRTLGGVAVCALFGAATAHASGFRDGRDCRGSHFETCAGVQVGMAEGHLGVSLAPLFRDGWGIVGHSRRFEHLPIADDPPLGQRDPGAVSECPVPSHNPLDCQAVTVTPEPVTMTLVATGLLTMSGAGMVRRRKQRRLE